MKTETRFLPPSKWGERRPLQVLLHFLNILELNWFMLLQVFFLSLSYKCTYICVQAICTNSWALCFAVLLGAGVKGNLKRPLKFHAQYPHKRLGETISRSDNPMDLHEPLQLDIGFGLGTKDETEDSDNPMDLEQPCMPLWSETKWA